MNVSESLVDEIRGQAYLIDHDDDVEGRRESVRLMLKVTAEQRSAGLSEAELRALGPSFATASLVHPDLVGRDGRQDVPHFWLYPLLAAPWVWLALTCGVSPLWGFVMLHALLLGGLAALILARPAPVWTSLLLLSPLVWWID